MGNEKVYEWKSKWPIVVAGGMFVTIGLALTIPDLISRGPIALAPLVLVLMAGAFGLSQAWKRLRSTRVTLSDTGLRRTSAYGEYFVPWNEMRLLRVRRNRKGQVRGILATSAKGKRIVLSGFEGMDEIAASIESHATTPQPSTPVTDALFNPYVAWPISIVGLIGMGMAALSQDGSDMQEVGYWLFFGSLVPSLWLFRNNLLTTLTSKTAWANFGKSTLLMFAFSLLMVGVLVLILFVVVRR